VPTDKEPRVIASPYSACTVLVLGDIMLDRYVFGEVRRISPEAPIPVLRAQSSRSVLGGAANVGKNVEALGARAILVGLIGDDAAGRELAALCPAEGRIALRAVVSAARPTTVKTRFMSGAHQLLRLDEEVAAPVEHEIDALLDNFRVALADADIVVLSDYAKGVLPDAVLLPAIAMAREAGRRVIADPKRIDLAGYAGVSVLTPNEIEVQASTGIAASSNEGAVEAGQVALDASGAEAVLVTRSAKGLTLVRRDAPPLHLPTQAREVADVSGAGDTLIASFAVLLASGADMAEAARVANVAAGLSVAKQGTATVDHHELAAALHAPSETLDSKITSLDRAAAQVRAWQAQGLRVGFTNGCFDLIHPGHVRLLTRARARCDRLVLGLNSDASVRRLKGPTRPVQNQASRSVVMAGMEAVDLVLVFEEDTPLEAISALLPNMLFKGADWGSIAQVVGSDVVIAHGGEVALLDFEDGHSTTGIIARASLGESAGEAFGESVP
jgi:D-beta-D-heptose 7-phosphate kinase / D-beta-D-heptose 1-phosphate adenosyltransferase